MISHHGLFNTDVKNKRLLRLLCGDSGTEALLRSPFSGVEAPARCDRVKPGVTRQRNSRYIFET